MPTLNILSDGQAHTAAFTGTPTLAQALAAAGFAMAQPCGGRGTCGKCAVTALSGEVSVPTPAETRAGVRLACQAVLHGDATVTLPAAVQWTAIQTSTQTAALGRPMAGRYGAAVDLGSTTIAAKVYDLASGALLGEHAALNPQTTIAADVMGRLSHALSGKLQTQTSLAQAAVADAVAGACKAAGVPAVQAQTIAGNTVMLTLLTGGNPAPLATAPFIADSLFGLETTLGGVPTYLPPCAGAFMGADLTCAALATNLCDMQETALLADIGTNGELMLWHQRKLYAASAPAGPAFEGGEISQGVGGIRGAIDKVWVEGASLGCRVIGGGQAVGVCGSGLIDAIAALLRLGLVDASGAADATHFLLRDAVYVTAGDIRAVQLAKAAIAAGIRVLLQTANASPAEVKRLLLAGGFGSQLAVESAASIGLVPAQFAARAAAVGNAALSGAALLLLDTQLRAKAQQIASNAQVVQLGGDEGFEKHFMAEMDFPFAEE